jgi:hypothetical protein
MLTKIMAIKHLLALRDFFKISPIYISYTIFMCSLKKDKNIGYANNKKKAEAPNVLLIN